MTPGFDPSDWLDILAYGIVALPATVAAVGAWRKASAAHYEVTNDHKSNIRHDIDQLGEKFESGLSEVREDIKELREEIQTESLARIRGDKRILRAMEG